MKNKFQTIQIWIPAILSEIKKEIRTEHLASSPTFMRTHFGHRPLNRITNEEIFTIYEKELLTGSPDLEDWVINRWVFKHGDVYQHFAERLSQIHPDFGSITSLDLSQSEKILEGASQAFGALPVYLFAYLNGVVFPEAVFEKLKIAAEKEETSKKLENQQREEQKNLLEAVEQAKKDIFTLHQKYENKMAGLLKKYATDTEGLKKQIRSLQQQLHHLKKEPV
jgi:hypothetical protein